MPRLRVLSFLAVAACVTAGVASVDARADAVAQIRPFGSPLPIPPQVMWIAQEARDALAEETSRRADEAIPVSPEPSAEDVRTEPVSPPAATTTLPTAPAPVGGLDPSTADESVVRADVLPNGIALPPLESPPEVRAIIEAGNGIARTPYLWGGGHGKWQDKGYDCSGSVSFALASAGLLDRSLTSGQLESWGKPGPGKWVTIWTNAGHVFLEVAGVRFDTSGTRTTGSRWQSTMRPTTGFVARHPQGL